MTLEDLEWRLIEETARSGPMQMALEEIAAQTVADGGPALVRTFRWAPSTLSLGYGQDASTVDWAFCELAGIDITRRQTGGGGIYHDHHADISYSIVVPKTAVSGDLLEAYHTLCEPILMFFEEIGLEASYADHPHDAIFEPACFLRDIHPAHDILIDGQKISGNAQYRQRDAVIQHGSILFDEATETHLSTFSGHSITAEGFEDRTTTILEAVDIDRSTAVAQLTECLGQWAGGADGEWTREELQSARDLAQGKYRSREWVREASIARPGRTGDNSSNPSVD